MESVNVPGRLKVSGCGVLTNQKTGVHNCVEKLDQSYNQKPAQSHWETNLVCRNVFFWKSL